MKQLSRCPVCESERVDFSYRGRSWRRVDAKWWEVYRCNECSLGFVNPQPSWEELAPYYSSAYDPYSGSHGATTVLGEAAAGVSDEEISDEEVVAEARKRGEFRHIRVTEGVRLLDVGCGGGFFLRIAARLGAVVEGVEPSEFGADRTRASGLAVFRGTVEEFVGRYPEKRFDIITANHVVEHTPEPVEVLKAMGELLAPGGYVWVSVPNPDCIFGRKLQGTWFCADLPIHLMQFTPQSLILAGARGP